MLGPGNDCLDKMEELWKDTMFSFYKKHALSKSGQGVGGKFNGVDIRFIMKDNHLQEVASRLHVEAEPFINYLRSIKELHSATVSKDFSLERCESAVFNFEVNFWYLHEQYQISMTLKVHVIIDYYVWYFKQMNKYFDETHGEYVEAVHYSLVGHEKTRNLKLKRNLCLSFLSTGKCLDYELS